MNSHISAFRCVSGLTFADPDECTRFYLCIDDQEVVLATCPNAYHYSVQFSTCLPPEDAECAEGEQLFCRFVLLIPPFCGRHDGEWR